MATGGKLYFSSEDSSIFVVKAGPNYKLLFENPMDGIVMATPAISDVACPQSMYQGLRESVPVSSHHPPPVWTGRDKLPRCCATQIDNFRLVAETLGMTRRYFAILITVWAFWGMPTLCVAGVLTHACIAEESCGPTDRHRAERKVIHSQDAAPTPIRAHADLHYSEKSNHEEGHEGPNHRSDCVSDPCSDSVVRPERQRDDMTVPLPDSVVLALLVVDEFFTPNDETLVLTDAVEARIQLSLHRSDLPLLI